jgi:hypothetical protein
MTKRNHRESNRLETTAVYAPGAVIGNLGFTQDVAPGVGSSRSSRVDHRGDLDMEQMSPVTEVSPVIGDGRSR